MLKSVSIVFTLILALPAAGAEIPPPVETIIYRTSACYGVCPAYSFIVSSNGQGAYNGSEYVAVKGEQTFQVTPDQFGAFRARLAPYRPPPDGETLVTGRNRSLCSEIWSDNPTVEVTWISNGHLAGHLVYYYGCKGPTIPLIMGHDLDVAPGLLPIPGFSQPK